MSPPIHLLLCIHNHQPVGNFDSVFRSAFERCYRPVIEAFERHPSVRFSIHHSGPLIDWALQNEGDYLDRLAALAMRGQAEILGGGYYEPILPTLKVSDALGQIGMMQDFWEERIGKRPKGVWLAERIWEPCLASLLRDALISFTVLDDQHFRHAGVAGATLTGYFRTERAGKAVSIFPSDQTLRYLIPFKGADEVIAHILRLQEKFPGSAVTYGDDGEKFGVWPGTHEWVIAQGWLEKFLSALEANRDRIATATPSEFMETHPPSGLAYLPTASYSEMLEWAMPAGQILEYERAKAAIEGAGLMGLAGPFIRGGFWDNFFAKYPEGNLIHKRAIHVSNRLDAAEAAGRKLPTARRALYRAQCNCAYWHGLFGGIYLNYLRHALYSNLIEAEGAADRAIEGDGPFSRAERLDVDCDGLDEAILANDEIFCLVKPDAGGAIAELDWRPARFNLLNTMARRFEAYHAPRTAGGHGGGGGIESIHELGKDLGDLKDLLSYDSTPRYALIDRAFAAEPDWGAILRGAPGDSPDLRPLSYKIAAISKEASGARLSLSAEREAQGRRLSAEKEYRLKGTRIEVAYNLKHEGTAPPAWFATEINFTLLAGHDRGRRYEWSGMGPEGALMDARFSIEGVGEIAAVDEAFGFRFKIESAAERAIILPIETVSQSEKGFDRIYQGSAIWLALRPSWQDGEAKFSVGISIQKL